MIKAYIIIAYDGTEIIDSTPEAEVRIAAMDDIEKRYIREQKRKANKQQKLAKNPIYRMACLCGIA